MVVASGMMLSVVNVSIVNIALPAMAADLGVDIPTISWVVTGFLVTQATLLAVAGPRGRPLRPAPHLRDRGERAHRRAPCCAPSPGTRPRSRPSASLQAMGACAMAPTAYAYAAELFGPRERGAALGVMGGVLGMAPVLALNIAGVLVGSFGWRSVFWFSPVMGALVLAGAFLVLVELRPPDADRDFDLLGAALAAVGLFPLLVALSRGEAWGWTSPATLAAASLGAAGVALFVWHESRASSPMIDLRPAAPPLLGHRQPGGHGLVGRPVRDAHPPAVLPHRGARVQRGEAGPRDHAGRGLVHDRRAHRGPLDRPRGLGPPRHGRPGGGRGRRGVDGAGGAVAELRGDPAGPDLLRRAASPCPRRPSRPPPSTTCPRPASGVASALPNISRYTGGALGAALLGAILHAYLTTGLDRSLGQVAPSGRDLVAEGFRTALLVAAVFLLAGAAAASRMPRLGSHEPAVAPPPSLDAPVAR